jgi:hypothetical protein
MNFSVPSGASREEIDAVVDRAFQAMYEAGDRGEPMDVALLFDEEEAGGNSNESNDNNNNNNNNNNDDNNDNNINLDIATTNDDNVCLDCEEDPCVFDTHKESLMAFDEAEHTSLAHEDVPPNNVRRKKLYRQLTLMMNGGPLGAGVRRPLPDCCVSAIREMLPSEIFMGFHTE